MKDRATVKAKCETWHLTYYKDGRAEGEDAVLAEVERHGHNFAPCLNEREAAQLIDALVTLMPATLRHCTKVAAVPAKRVARGK